MNSISKSCDYILIADVKKGPSLESFRKPCKRPDTETLLANESHTLQKLTTGIVHDVRNALNAISVVADALFLELGNTDELSEYKKHIFKHIDHLEIVMKSLLEFGMPVEKKGFINTRLNKIIDESVKFCQKINVHFPEIVFQTDLDPNLEILADSGRIYQAFVNILQNSFDHNKNCQKITVTTSVNDDLCCVKFSDNGHGIETQNLSCVFDPFFTTNKDSIGLGLPIAKRIIESHNGSVSIYNNEPGTGCTVEIKLPVYKK
ncbi:MAG: ATP-binding protein [Fibrobacter sp.]|nr:ATP-binding protein [Fibrobacter sp.]